MKCICPSCKNWKTCTKDCYYETTVENKCPDWSLDTTGSNITEEQWQKAHDSIISEELQNCN